MISDSELVAQTQKIWKELGLKVAPGVPSTAENDDGGPLITGCVQITGPWEGVVTLECTADLARQVAAIMFSMEAETLTEEIVIDAFGELTNMSAGNFKALLAHECALSLPTVVEGRLGFPGSRIINQVPMQCEGHVLRLLILKKDENYVAGKSSGQIPKIH